MMRSTLTRRSALGSLVLAACLLAPGSSYPGPGGSALLGPQTAAAAGACVDGWQTMDLPDGPARQWLFDVVTDKGRPAWLLGGSFGSGYLAYRWRNGRWVETDVPTARYRGLLGGDVVGGRELLAAGFAKTGPPGLRGVGGNLKGTRWTDLDAPPPRRGGSTFADIAAAGRERALAVGARFDRGRSSASASLWDGTSWRAADPAVGGRGSGLTAASATPSGQLWAVGWRQASNGRTRPIVLRHAGASWSDVRTAHVPGGSAVFTDVAFDAPKRGWLIGYLVRAGQSGYEALLQRWDGRRWRNETLPWGREDSVLPRAISPDGRGGIWIAATRLADADGEQRGLVAHREDDVWTVDEVGTGPGLQSDMRAVAATRDGAIAAGSVGGFDRIERLLIRTCGSDDVTGPDANVPDASPPADPTPSGAAAETDETFAPAQGTVPRRTLGKPERPQGFRVRDVAESVGLGERTETWQGLVADFDGDGWEDIFYSRHLGFLPRLFLGGADGFAEPTTLPFEISDPHGCAAADVDADGNLDLYCATGRVRGTALDRPDLYLDPALDDARLVPDALGAVDPFGRGRVVTFFDLEADGDEDLFLTADPTRVDALPSTNRLFRNEGGHFVPAPEVGLDTPTGGRCVWSGDLDRDGDDDLIVCETKPQDAGPPGVRVYRNEGGTLRERSRALGIAPQRDVFVHVAELSGDRRPDIVQLGDGRLRINRQTRSGFTPIFETRLRHAVAVASGDVNGDGHEDLYVVRGGRENKPDLLLVNDGTGRRWSSVRIPQAKGGVGEFVMAIDHDQNGLADFVVLNGGRKKGPVQLLASFPAG